MKTENEIQEQIEYLTKAIEKYSQYKQSCNEMRIVNHNFYQLDMEE